jgi:hypothetical protein
MLFRLFVFVFTVTAAASVSAQTARAPQARAQRDQSPVNVLSIVPAQAEPGRAVTLFGSGFLEGTTAFLGNTAVPTAILGNQQLSFEIPNLSPGLYALFLKRRDGTTSKIYNFTVQAQKPVVTGLSPDRIFSCGGGRDREVQIGGRFFQEQSMVLFDGAAIRSRFVSPEALSFTVPEVPGGLHQIQVRNSEEALSTITAFFIDSKPEIVGVTQGAESVNSYQLIIQGRNFLPNSSLLVDGRRLSGASTNPIERERVTYIDCNQMVYERFPYDTTPKTIRMQILNPNGESSPAVQISAP